MPNSQVEKNDFELDDILLIDRQEDSITSCIIRQGKPLPGI